MRTATLEELGRMFLCVRFFHPKPVKPDIFRQRVWGGRVILAAIGVLVGFWVVSAGLAQPAQQVRVGVYEDPPLVYTSDDGTISGFWADLIHHIAAENGWEIVWVPGTWEEGLARLAADEIDVMPNVSPDVEENFAFILSHEPVLISWSRVYTPRGVEIQGWEGLEGMTVGVVKGKANYEGLEGIKALTGQFEVYCTFWEYEQYAQIFQALENGELDAGIVEKDFGNWGEGRYAVARTPIVFQSTTTHFAVARDRASSAWLVEQLDEAVRTLKTDSGSVYYQAQDRYLEQKPTDLITVIAPQWVKNAVIAGGSILALLIAVGLTTRVQLMKRTKELQESEARFRSLVEHVPILIDAFDEKGNIVVWNKQCEKVTGFTAEEIIGNPAALSLLYPNRAYREQMLEAWRDPSYRGAAAEWDLTTKSGEVRTILWLTFSNRISIPGWASWDVGIDITERKKSEIERQTLVEIAQGAAIAQSLSEFLRHIHRSIARVIYAENFMVILYNNNTGLFEEVYSVDQYDPPSAPSKLEKSISAYVFRTGKPLLLDQQRFQELVDEGEVELIGTDSTSWLGVPLIVDDETIGVMAVQDYERADRYTENDKDFLLSIASQVALAVKRKQAEEALMQFRRLIDESSDAIFLIDPVTSRYVDFNRTALLKLGYTAEELRQIGVIDVAQHITSMEVWRQRSDLVQKSDGLIFETAYQRKDGTWFPVEVSAKMLDYAGNAIILAVVRDSTERKKVEEALARQTANLSVLYNLSVEISATLDVMNVYGLVHRAAFQLMPGEVFVISLLSEDESEIEDVYLWENDRLWEGDRYPAGEDLAGYILATGKPLRVADWDEAADRLTGAVNFGSQRFPVRSVLAVPLFRTGSKPLGMLSIQAYSADAYSQEHEQLLVTIAAQAAKAIENARLFAQLQQELNERKLAERKIQGQVQRLTALRTIEMAISSSFDVRMTLEVLLEQVVTLLKVDAADILLFNPNTLMLEYAVLRGFRSAEIRRTLVKPGDGLVGQVIRQLSPIHVPDLAQELSQLSRPYLVTVEGFVDYHGLPLVAKGQIKGVLEIFHRAPFEADIEWLEFLDSLAWQAAVAIDNAQLFDDLQRSNLDLAFAYDSTIEGWSRAMELRDKETEGHTQRVAEITLRLARMMNVPEKDIVHIRRGALLHDIGKMGIPDYILLKPGKLTEEEWAIMRKHPEFAYNMLSSIPFLKPALDIPYCHHEKWDGTGYPRGLRGESIPLAARIFAVVDVWDALCSPRPYRESWPKDKVRQYIKEQSGKHFDPRVVELFLKLVESAE